MCSEHTQSVVVPPGGAGRSIVHEPLSLDDIRNTYVDRCLRAENIDETCPNITILAERDGVREVIRDAVSKAVVDHLVGLEVLERLGFIKTAQHVRQSLPTKKRIRSGDLGEVLAADYVSQKTPFITPVKRLRYKDDRDMSMRGDDLLAIHINGTAVRLLKVEVKSRASLSPSTVSEASTMLMKHAGRPSPSTLNFVVRILRLHERDNEADLIESLQNRELQPKDLKHLIFTFSGNHPRTALAEYRMSPVSELERELVGVYISDHQAFIQTVFENLDAAHN